MTRFKILIVDNNQEEAALTAETLADLGEEIIVTPTAEDAFDVLADGDVDLVVTELVAEEIDGLQVLREAKRIQPDSHTILLARRADVASAVEALEGGALAYLMKPLNPKELLAVIRRALQRVQLEKEHRTLSVRVSEKYGFDRLIGGSPVMQKVFERMHQAAPTDATVLITGETGTGKELVAQCLHEHSHRRGGPFHELNCAALSESILESELFGHEKGAFTGATTRRIGAFEYASGGTLFLDEVGDLPMATQIKLLRVLENREIQRVGSNEKIPIDIRLIAATNQNLESMIEEGTFREDLFYRLNVINIQLPPLRERKGDIPLLVDAFVEEASERYGKELDGASQELIRHLSTLTWPGNVRELKNCIDRMVVFAEGPELEMADLPEKYQVARLKPAGLDSLAGLSMEEVEKEHIRKTLEMTGGNREEAANLLGIGERTLYRKIKKYDLR